MSVRSIGYDSENLDSIFCYFMRLILHLEKNGVEGLPLENNLPKPYKCFLDTAMRLFLECMSPELSRLLLETECYSALKQTKAVKEEILGIQLIKELTWHIYYDNDYYGYLLATENLWGNTALEYAQLTFYPNLPKEIKDKYNIIDIS